jgi:hypothetical protein
VKSALQFALLHYCNGKHCIAASSQLFQCAENKYKAYDINMLNQKRVNGTIVALLINEKKEDPNMSM